MAIRIPQDAPVYRLTEPFYDPHDNLHPVDAIIKFDGHPNQGMMPLNDKAVQAYDAYMDRLDAGLKAVCEAEKREFTPHTRIYDEPDLEIADVSRGSQVAEKATMRLGGRRKSGSAAEAIG